MRLSRRGVLAAFLCRASACYHLFWWKPKWGPLGEVRIRELASPGRRGQRLVLLTTHLSRAMEGRQVGGCREQREVKKVRRKKAVSLKIAKKANFLLSRVQKDYTASRTSTRGVVGALLGPQHASNMPGT